MRRVVDASSPVLISSSMSTGWGPTIISPVVTRLRCPPDTPRTCAHAQASTAREDGIGGRRLASEEGGDRRSVHESV